MVWRKNFFYKNIYKIFSITVVFLCCTNSVKCENISAAIEPYIGRINSTITDTLINDTKINSDLFLYKYNDTTTNTVNLCTPGYYLAKCGNFTIGTKLLKGMTKTVNNQTIKTPDYWSYNASVSNDDINIQNLRKLIAGKENIRYITKKDESDVVSPTEYTVYLNQILSNFCTDSEGFLGDISCEPCPYYGQTVASTIQKDGDTGKLFWNTWKIQTIADCYLTEFSDDTGSYIYSSSADQQEPLNCHYSIEVPGSDFYQK